MREILFKGKRKDNGEWIEGFYFENFGESWIVGTEYQKEAKTKFCFQVIRETVSQYTGLNDINGNKIFENDIIRSVHNKKELNISYVKFEDGDYLCKLISGVFIDLFETLSEQSWECALEVIGNIHDNSELLEDES